MRLKPINYICPKCKNANYMRLIEGKNVGRYNVKCINCNSYYNYDEITRSTSFEQVRECCATCKRLLKLEMYDYANAGCIHRDIGYACTAFEDEGKIIWKVGEDFQAGMCEVYEPKEG